MIAPQQGDLFAPRRDPVARLRPQLHHDVESSQREEERLARNFRGIARKILTWVESRPTTGASRGATRAEISEALGIRIQSVCPAVYALRNDGFLLELDGKDGRPKLERGGGNVLVATGRRE
jgi:hypothetical protein